MAEAEEPPLVIDPAGDLVLTVSDKAYPDTRAAFRVSSSKLKPASKYFAILFDGTKFEEGKRLQRAWKDLRKQYGGDTFEGVPTIDLPVVNVERIGRIGQVKNFRGLLGDFFRALHGLDLSLGTKNIARVSLANLAIVADRFDAIDALRAYVKKRHLMQNQGPVPVATTTKKPTTPPRRSSVAEGIRTGIFVSPQFKAANQTDKKTAGAATQATRQIPLRIVAKQEGPEWTEEKCRIRILAGVLLEDSGWLWDSSTLIARGSMKWKADAETMDLETSPLWWDLPWGLEGKLFSLLPCKLMCKVRKMANASFQQKSSVLEEQPCYTLFLQFLSSTSRSTWPVLPHKDQSASSFTTTHYNVMNINSAK
jgi:hypothetical protein